MTVEDNSSIFNADKANPSNTSNSTAATAAELSALVGEGKKYKTVDDLAKAYVSADTFIEQLKAENTTLREKATASKTIDDVLERLHQQQNSTTKDPGNVSVTDLAKLVEQTVTGLETKKSKTTNLLAADKKMKEMFGEKAQQTFESVATTPELRNIYMELAAADPDKFVKMFLGTKSGTTVDAGGGVNTTVNYSDGNSNRSTTVGTKDYYDSVRKTNPSEYYSQAFQLSMDKQVRSNPNLYYGKRSNT